MAQQLVTTTVAEVLVNGPATEVIRNSNTVLETLVNGPSTESIRASTTVLEVLCSPYVVGGSVQVMA